MPIAATGVAGTVKRLSICNRNPGDVRRTCIEGAYQCACLARGKRNLALSQPVLASGMGNGNSSTRRLAAILVSDVVGYSRMMGSIAVHLQRR
jgi:hypothetical protein